MPEEHQDKLHDKVISIILAGGQGTRLDPLTRFRCKPAVSFGGRYRLIDIPISNSLHSRIQKIFVISQYFASGLQQHLSSTYLNQSLACINLSMLCPEETEEGIRWFRGTADAVRQNLSYFQDLSAEYYLILSGDQLYNIDLLRMVEYAKSTNADLVIASLPVQEKEAKRMGLLQINAHGLITNFYEKPSTKELLDQFVFEHKKGAEKKYLGSMGIYVFKKQVLEQLLQEAGDDFGKDLIPIMISKKKSFAFVYEGYWEDIGTVSSFYEANLALIDRKNCLNISDPSRPIFAQVHRLPNALVKGAKIDQSLISPGCLIEAKEVYHSLIGLSTHVGEGSVIRDSVIIGNNISYGENPLRIGKNCVIEKAIIDEDVEIGHHVQLINKKKQMHYDGDGIFIRDGIIVVASKTRLPDHFVL